MSQFGEAAFVGVDNPEDSVEEKEEEEKKRIKIRFCIFFDGTCNNRTNTDKRTMASETDKTDTKHKEAAAIYAKYKGNDSYENDYTNVAKMEKYIDKAEGYKLTLRTYIEGPGTEDNEGDSTLGYAMGVGSTGVRKKVEKGVLDVVSKITKKVKEEVIIECLTLDVFGFSRGAAGARNFIHEALNGDELETIKTQMQDKGYKVKTVEVYFAGLYDTVSSHGLFYFNDVSDLKLRAVRHAKKVIQLAAADEHRENFSLTSIQSAGFKGREIFLPGVHSDIGGSYTDSITEDQMIFDGIEQVAVKDRMQLIESGWYKEHEIELISYEAMDDDFDTYAMLTVNRPNVSKGDNANVKGISNQYSLIPLHIMARFARENTINILSNLERVEGITGVLNSAKQHIDKYITETDPDNPTSRKSCINDWHGNEKSWLRDLRHDYFHFSAKWKFGLKPRMSGGIRHRKTYNG